MFVNLGRGVYLISKQFSLTSWKLFDGSLLGGEGKTSFLDLRDTKAVGVILLPSHLVNVDSLNSQEEE